MGFYYWSCERCNQIKANVQTGTGKKSPEYQIIIKEKPNTCTIFLAYNGTTGKFNPSDWAIRAWAKKVCDNTVQTK